MDFQPKLGNSKLSEERQLAEITNFIEENVNDNMDNTILTKSNYRWL